jgi:benzodiazapine receptor
MERYIPVIITLLTIFGNYIVGKDVKNISDKYNMNITPKPFTFGIWGLIYILLLYVTFVHHKEILEIKTKHGSILNLFIISAVLNVLWLYTWGKNLVLSSLILIVLAYILIVITIELNKANVNKVLLYTFGIYTAWVIIACILNLSVLFLNNGMSQDIIKILAIIILSIIPFIIKKHFGKAVIPMLITLIWGSIGIIANNNHNLLFIIPIITSVLNIKQ